MGLFKKKKDEDIKVIDATDGSSDIDESSIGKLEEAPKRKEKVQIISNIQCL